MTPSTPAMSTLSRPSAQSRITAIALMELRIILRTRTVLTGTVLAPLAMAVFASYFGANEFGGPSGAAITAGLTLVLVALPGVYLTAVTTLTTRREELFLERLRSGESSDAVILLGMLAPIIGLVAAQVLVIAAAAGLVGFAAPAHPALVLGTAGGFLALCATAGLLTSNHTPSAAAARITTLPFVALVMGTFLWATFEDTYQNVQRLTPGGAVQELLTAAWSTEPLGAPVLVSGVALLAWTMLPCWWAGKHFRWDRR